VAGISAGANIAASIAHLARDEHLTPRLTGIYLSIPSLLEPSVVPPEFQDEYVSRHENRDAPILNQGAIDLFRSIAYL
jgi:acetyl esterase/lipase